MSANIPQRAEGEPLDAYLARLNIYMDSVREHIRSGSGASPFASAPVGTVPAAQAVPSQEPAAKEAPLGAPAGFVMNPAGMTGAQPPKPVTPVTPIMGLIGKEAKKAAKAAKKKAKAEKRAAPANLPGKLGTLLGDYRFSIATTVLNAVTDIFWLISYVVCIIERSSLFAQAQAEMMSVGAASYRITVTSPFFGVLKFLLFLLPVVLILWCLGVVFADKKSRKPVDKKVLLGVFALNLIVGIVALADVAKYGLLFG